MLAGQPALVAAAFFASAALYISRRRAPRADDARPEIAPLVQWKPAYDARSGDAGPARDPRFPVRSRRPWWLSGDWLWLLGALAMIAPLPWTLFAIMPDESRARVARSPARRRESRPLLELAVLLLGGRKAAPPAWLVFEPEALEGLRRLRPGDRADVLTWLDRARRRLVERASARRYLSRTGGRLQYALASSPESDRSAPVEITAIDGLRVHVDHLEVLDGTPILDIKPTISADVSKR